MRAVAFIFILSACPALHARTRAPDTLHNILGCAFSIGPVKCMNALSAWRAQRAIDHPNSKSNLTLDLQQFPWNNYRNDTNEELYSDVCQKTEQLLRKRSLTFTAIPGYRLELLSKGNGTLSVDVYKNAESRSSRGSLKKGKTKKNFYKFLPLMILPGLIMSAILPFILPALKMMVLSVGMLNNMALSGAVFTLLRNNAFDDKYDNKVIYVNEGYKNEKHAHSPAIESQHEPDHGSHYSDYQFVEQHPAAVEMSDIEAVDELPLNGDWIKQYYGDGQHVQIVQSGHSQIKRGVRPHKLKSN